MLPRQRLILGGEAFKRGMAQRLKELKRECPHPESLWTNGNHRRRINLRRRG